MADQKTITLIEQLSSLSIKLSSGGDHAEEARNEALQLSRKLTASLEKPANVAVDLAFSPFLSVAARIAVDLGLFKHIVDHDGPVTSEELASMSGGEELLIIRILRPLASMGFVDEVGERTWQATPTTEAMATEEISAGHRMIAPAQSYRADKSMPLSSGEMIVGAAHKAPKYFKEAGYRCPTNPHDGLMQYAFQTKLMTFDFFRSMPSVFRDFNTFMGNTMGARTYWVDWFPVPERLLEGATQDAALLVDVGAGKGHDLIAFHEKYPHRGHLVLQDLASVLENLGHIDPAIERMPHDFSTEQPVQGARAYFLHHILHDWPDHTCLEILAKLKKAMKPGYSKLLLHEMIIPEKGAPTFYSMLDIAMMAFNAGIERTERQFEALLGKAGFKVVKFWHAPDQGADGIVEAMVID
ncbi:Demethylsterigmatocystin 6-O-methyltransferase [Cytospora mali]|uniref:Demethylsterigmatocystin 6-O-methyltransferase n=1 Tax=Cytospora mali TaxID=578113 RepID=A0A194USF2_CYTMA|nr:Demethylsterigmatocystin 6-O-methyltransferase [Valsa mali var. pyri (nom. inval.)]